MTRFEDTRSWYQDIGNLEENFSPKKIDSIWFSRSSCHVLTEFELFRLWSAWLPFLAPGIRVHSCISTEIDQRNPTLIMCSSPWKRIHAYIADKRERGAESFLLRFFFLFAWLSFSFLDSHAHSTHSPVSRIVYSEWNVSPKGKFRQFMQISRVFFHKLHHPSCCSGNLADCGRQFHENDRGTRSQSENEEGPSRLSH